LSMTRSCDRQTYGKPRRRKKKRKKRHMNINGRRKRAYSDRGDGRKTKKIKASEKNDGASCSERVPIKMHQHDVLHRHERGTHRHDEEANEHVEAGQAPWRKKFSGEHKATTDGGEGKKPSATKPSYTTRKRGPGRGASEGHHEETWG